MRWTEKKWLNNEDLRLVLAPGLEALSKGGKAPITDRKLRRIVVEFIGFAVRGLSGPAALSTKMEDFVDGKIEMAHLNTAFYRHKKCSAFATFGFPGLSAESSRYLQVQEAMAWLLYCFTSTEPGLVGLDGVLYSFRSRKLHPKLCEKAPFIMTLLHDILGNPFRPVSVDPSWLTPTVRRLAQSIHDDRSFDDLPVLADALEEVGCRQDDILTHCRSEQGHVRGCWVVDLVMGKD